MKLGDLDPQVLVSALGDEAQASADLATPGTSNFTMHMGVARTLTFLAIALNATIKHELDRRGTHARDSEAT